MVPDSEPLATLSRSAATAMLTRLDQLHRGAKRQLDASLTMSMPELQAISTAAKQDALRRQFELAKAGREAGGVGAERRFDRALADIDVIDQGWERAVQASFDRQVQDWVHSGESLLGPGGWLRVAVRPYQRGSIWWTDHDRTIAWCRLVARDVFTSVAADPRSATTDAASFAQLSEPSIGPAIDSSIMMLLGDFQDQQRYDAARYGVHPVQAHEAAERIHGMRAPLTQVCRSELERLLREWQTLGPPPVDTGAGEDSGNQREFPTGG